MPSLHRSAIDDSTTQHSALWRSSSSRSVLPRVSDACVSPVVVQGTKRDLLCSTSVQGPWQEEGTPYVQSSAAPSAHQLTRAAFRTGQGEPGHHRRLRTASTRKMHALPQELQVRSLPCPFPTLRRHGHLFRQTATSQPTDFLPITGGSGMLA